MDLDEYSEHVLVAELKRRNALRVENLCDYCRRSADSTPCKFPERHKKAGDKIQRLISL